MTAEVAVLNKTAVALAADSAVTIRGGQIKVYNSVNKLFSLSKYHPVGVMIYGNAEVDGVPWESLIKTFRLELSETHLPTVAHYADQFCDFLSNNILAFSAKRQEDAVRAVATSLANGVVNAIKGKVKEHLKARPLTAADESGIIDSTVHEYRDKWDTSPFLEGFNAADEDLILDKYGTAIEDAFKRPVEALPLTPDHIAALRITCARVFCRQLYLFPTSGVVIAGFGDDEIFPALVDLQIRCVVADKVRIGYRNSTSVEADGASINPFAQRETVEGFIEGVNPRFKSLLRAYLEEVLNDFPGKVLKDSIDWQNLPAVDRALVGNHLKTTSSDLLKLILTGMDNYVNREHVLPMLNTVEMLPKDELASMAEALVSLTAFKQRVSMDTETVGGPIDVAVISKGDGFVWIKRKHYFEAELNPQFFAKYNRRQGAEA